MHHQAPQQSQQQQQPPPQHYSPQAQQPRIVVVNHPLHLSTMSAPDHSQHIAHQQQYGPVFRPRANAQVLNLHAGVNMYPSVYMHPGQVSVMGMVLQART